MVQSTAVAAAIDDTLSSDTIVCNASAQAARAAIALAGRDHRRVIVVDPRGPVPAPTIAGAPVPLPEVFSTDLLSRLDVPEQASGADVEVRTIYGFPVPALTGIARAESAALLVVGAEAHRHRRLLRSLPVRVAIRATVPVLAVREADSIERWLDRKSVLRVMVAIDRSPAAKLALEWASAFAGDLPIDVVAAGLDPAVKPADWQAEDAVLEIATKWQADLLVVGIRCATNPLARWWRRSPAERLIAEVPMNVVAVPCGSRR